MSPGLNGPAAKSFTIVRLKTTWPKHNEGSGTNIFYRTEVELAASVTEICAHQCCRICKSTYPARCDMLASYSMTHDSEMQRRFGAKISVTPPPSRDRQIFLLTGTEQHLARLIRAQGGQPLFIGPGWALAELGFSQAMLLRGAPGIRTVSGVSIDPERIESLNQLVGQNTRGGVTHA